MCRIPSEQERSEFFCYEYIYLLYFRLHWLHTGENLTSNVSGFFCKRHTNKFKGHVNIYV